MRAAYILGLCALCMVTALVAGCAGDLGNTYYVDDDFSVEENAQITAAGHAWAIASHRAMAPEFIFGQHVDPTLGSAWGRNVIARVSIPETYNTEVTGVQDGDPGSTWRSPGKFEIIAVVPAWFGTHSLGEIVMHELGHHFAQNTTHSPDPAALMAPGSPVSRERYVTGMCLSSSDLGWLGAFADTTGFTTCAPDTDVTVIY